MTIAKRLIILLALPWLVLVGLGVLNRFQLAKVETRVRFAGEFQIKSLASNHAGGARCLRQLFYYLDARSWLYFFSYNIERESQ